MTQQTKPITFEYDKAKATQVILWLLHRHGVMDKLKIVKLIFFADREHLARYGRPIIGGNYVAMPHGPVSSELLDYINQMKREEGTPLYLDGNELHSKQPVNEDYLSESEVEVLEEINKKYGNCDPWTLRNITHKLKAYQKNYPDHTHTSVPLSYEDFFLDLDDNSILDIIQEDQEARADLK